MRFGFGDWGHSENGSISSENCQEEGGLLVFCYFVCVCVTTIARFKRLKYYPSKRLQIFCFFNNAVGVY